MKFVHIILGYANAGVLDCEEYLALIVFDNSGYTDMIHPLDFKFECIAEKVDQDLSEPAVISDDSVR